VLHAAIRFAYDGTQFDAYARDPHVRTVEGCLQEALAPAGYVAGTIKTGSRTDARVSALENVVRGTFDRRHLRGFVPGVQKHLPMGLWVTAAAVVPEQWNPRHAVDRTYRYDAPDLGEDPERLQAAWRAFEGTHDMRAFARLEADRNPVRRILACSVEGPEDGHWRLRVTSPGFLWNQVRRMVDAALAVGRGEAQVRDIEESLRSGKPHRAFELASPEGLLLERVRYDGLAWDPEAGGLGRDRIVRGLQAARVRHAVMAHLRDLAL
jgi:tRNA pseudouridine38-40 synthase